MVLPAENSKTDKDVQSETIQEFIKRRDGAFNRFPLVLTLFGTFGVVSVFYGFSHVLDKFPVFARDPIIPLLTGLVILVLTGTLYKKLG
jgi:hypothetical protein